MCSKHGQSGKPDGCIPTFHSSTDKLSNLRVLCLCLWVVCYLLNSIYLQLTLLFPLKSVKVQDSGPIGGVGKPWHLNQLFKGHDPQNWERSLHILQDLDLPKGDLLVPCNSELDSSDYYNWVLSSLSCYICHKFANVSVSITMGAWAKSIGVSGSKRTRRFTSVSTCIILLGSGQPAKLQNVLDGNGRGGRHVGAGGQDCCCCW